MAYIRHAAVPYASQRSPASPVSAGVSPALGTGASADPFRTRAPSPPSHSPAISPGPSPGPSPSFRQREPGRSPSPEARSWEEIIPHSHSSWALAWRVASPRTRAALQFLFQVQVVTTRELQGTHGNVSEKHVQECIDVAKALVAERQDGQAWDPEKARQDFGERLAAKLPQAPSVEEVEALLRQREPQAQSRASRDPNVNRRESSPVARESSPGAARPSWREPSPTHSGTGLRAPREDFREQHSSIRRDPSPPLAVNAKTDNLRHTSGSAGGPTGKDLVQSLRAIDPYGGRSCPEREFRRDKDREAESSDAANKSPEVIRLEQELKGLRRELRDAVLAADKGRRDQALAALVQKEADLRAAQGPVEMPTDELPAPNPRPTAADDRQRPPGGTKRVSTVSAAGDGSTGGYPGGKSDDVASQSGHSDRMSATSSSKGKHVNFRPGPSMPKDPTATSTGMTSTNETEKKRVSLSTAGEDLARPYLHKFDPTMEQTAPAAPQSRRVGDRPDAQRNDTQQSSGQAVLQQTDAVLLAARQALERVPNSRLGAARTTPQDVPVQLDRGGLDHSRRAGVRSPNASPGPYARGRDEQQDLNFSRQTGTVRSPNHSPGPLDRAAPRTQGRQSLPADPTQTVRSPNHSPVPRNRVPGQPGYYEPAQTGAYQPQAYTAAGLQGPYASPRQLGQREASPQTSPRHPTNSPRQPAYSPSGYRRLASPQPVTHGTRPVDNRSNPGVHMEHSSVMDRYTVMG